MEFLETNAENSECYLALFYGKFYNGSAGQPAHNEAALSYKKTTKTEQKGVCLKKGKACRAETGQ